MPNLKHVGRLRTNNRKCIVAYRVIPGDPDHCLVVHTESLDSDQHDTLINLVESNAGQSAYELADAMARTPLPDGRNMLAAFHKQGKLNKLPTKDVEMIPNNSSSINLAQLNQIIADQKGVTIADLAVKGPNGETVQPIKPKQETPIDTASMYVEPEISAQADVLSNEDLAKQLRSQADSLFKEAQQLRKQAEELSPTKKAITKKKQTVVEE
jgi:phenylpropionate dioxygenase-like ring-hydroxylating dioxygenase large terminal subunit